MIRNTVLLKSLQFVRVNVPRRLQSNSLNIEKLEEETQYVNVVHEEVKLKDELIEKKRNKSRLTEAHRNILFEEKPYAEPKIWVHGTTTYQRKMYGRYGEKSGVNPALCWPTENELSEKTEYERIAYPHTIQEMVKTKKAEREQKMLARRERDQHIVQKMQKLDGWVKEMKEKIAKKEAETMAAKERRDKLIEEVRRYFGYTVDPRDDKFKELLEKKEKEQKKAMKEAKKKAKEEKMVDKLLAVPKAAGEESKEASEDKQPDK